ncbi:substrate-binding domain-containing protein [uncultured Tateyamaria sp.]|uniref:substrate-binding domain-containing protein n=1 Tax=uncultured Tateyamaria sp. TaxID=455651 RepID=UPI00261A11BD|nr:substrate-binding domain-containing protein [uncultured Tateyamaria sp.]
MAENRSNQVAVIIPSLTNNIFTEVMTGITSELERVEYHAVVGVSDYDLNKEESLIVSMMSWRPAAIIVSNAVHTERATNILRNTDIPVVEIMSLSAAPIDINIGINHRKAAHDLAQYVISKGYRRFGFLGWNERDIAAAERFSEIQSVIHQHGHEFLPPDPYDSPPNFLRGKEGLKGMLQDNPKLDAVFFPNDTTAIGGMIHCIESGIDIPGDVAIAGFSGLAVGQNMPLRLTTIQTKRFETGQLAASEIIRRLNGRSGIACHDMGYVLLGGQTT